MGNTAFSIEFFEHEVAGSCLCGHIRFSARGPWLGGWGCSCQYCRKFFGAPLSTLGMVLAQNFLWTQGVEQLRYFEKLPNTGPRSFCGICGSPMAMLIDSALMGIPLSCLDDDPDVDLQVVLTDLPRWAAAIDVLPRMAEVPDFHVRVWNALSRRLVAARSLGANRYAADVASLVDVVAKNEGFDAWLSSAAPDLETAIRTLLTAGRA